MKKKITKLLSVALSFVTAFSAAGIYAPVTARADETMVAVTEANFPDEEFRGAVKLVDADGDGMLSKTEIEGVTDLSIFSFYSDGYYGNGYLVAYGVADVTGIEYFTNLDYFNISGPGKVEKLDLTPFKKLKTFSADRCENLKEVDVTGLEELGYIYIVYCDLFKSLDVSTNKGLYTVGVNGCDEFSDFKCGEDNSVLSSVYVYGPALKELDLSKLSDLQYLALCDCEISIDSLGIQDKSKIKELSICYNHSSGFKPEEFKNLRFLEFNCNGITSIDLSKNKKLEQLSLTYNSIEKIDLSKNKKLWSLDMSGNGLVSLNLSKNKKMSSLTLYDNDLKKLDLSKCKKLGMIDVTKNSALKKLDLSKCKQIGYIQTDTFTKFTLPKDTYTVSYYDYSTEQTIEWELKGTTANADELGLGGTWVSFIGENHQVGAFFPDYY